MKRLLFIILIVMLLAGCAEGISNGTVNHKTYKPRSVTYVSVGDTKVPITHPAEWYVEFENDGKVGSCKVSESTFDHIEIGQWYGC